MVVLERATYSVPEFAVLAGIGRNSAYEAVRRGEVQAVRIGKRLIIPRSTVEAMLGIGSPPLDTPEDAVDLSAVDAR